MGITLFGELKNMFRLHNISKTFQSTSNEIKHILDHITFEIPKEKIISLIGPSGCGKTTLLRIIAGFDSDFDGQFLYKMDNQSEYSSFIPLGKVGYIPQENSLFPWLTVEENIRFGLNSNKVSKSEQEKISSELLALVNLTNFRKYYPKELSGGMKQKVAICRALAINPMSNFILMDEPFSALDAQTRNFVQADLLDLWQKQHLTILFVTHNIDEAVFLSDIVHVMSPLPGQIIKSVSIDLPRPRDRTSPGFNQIRRELLNLLHQ
jgi:NitT/TauT family transport system ATP-binding protein